jgi:hypothetical protein
MVEYTLAILKMEKWREKAVSHRKTEMFMRDILKGVKKMGLVPLKLIGMSTMVRSITT